MPPPQPLLQLPPNATRIIINIGSNKDPPVSHDPTTYTIAFEPVIKTASLITPHPRVLVVCAAVGPQPGLAVFYTYAKEGEASSLSQAADPSVWWAVIPEGFPPVSLVPVLTLRTVLEAIPRHLEIVYLKIDAEGMDLEVIESAGDAITRAQVVQCEIHCKPVFKNTRTTFATVNAVLEPLGFTDPREDKCLKPERMQFDGFWTASKGCTGPYCARTPLPDGSLELTAGW